MWAPRTSPWGSPKISFTNPSISPIARALLKAREGDVVKLVTPGGTHEVELLSVVYPAPGPGAA